MTPNSKAIVTLCSHLCVGENVKPYEPAEWAILAELLMNQNIEPNSVLAFSADDFKSKLNFTNVEIERMNRLIDRGGSIAFEIQRYADMGINIMTRADTFYPILLKNKLGKSCPPIFYYAGNPNLTKKRCIGFVGSRNVGLDDEDFTVKTVKKCNSKDFLLSQAGQKV